MCAASDENVASRSRLLTADVMASAALGNQRMAKICARLIKRHGVQRFRQCIARRARYCNFL